MGAISEGRAINLAAFVIDCCPEADILGLDRIKASALNKIELTRQRKHTIAVQVGGKQFYIKKQLLYTNTTVKCWALK